MHVNITTNITKWEEEEEPWSSVEKSVIVVILSIQIVLGILGNCLVLIVKMVCRDQYQCVYWLPFVSLTLSDLCCSLLIMTSSLLAVLTGGQRSPWCEVVSLFKFTFITSSIGSIGAIFGVVPVIYNWVRFDPAEMMCAVFWESSYSDMLVYILCTITITILPSFLLIITCSLLTWAGYGKNCARPSDLSSVTPLLVGTYLICYTPFILSEKLGTEHRISHDAAPLEQGLSGALFKSLSPNPPINNPES
ncbi:hypothetical protein QTP70_003546 [Hemibagrus guttatus]|uniref:G-protein coupled receptors family 1 profile domain-containing protein n=1 Tax=Hemibagrus guttatus TaxID=175788 RepID=A0AAE0RH42_9TELE|nr:hypothetical protein QTP70_003546 [Hemibagrus guttatus]